MKKVITLTTTTVGSAAGWWLGSDFGIMTAFMVSIVGFGIGLYYGTKLAKNIEI